MNFLVKYIFPFCIYILEVVSGFFLYVFVGIPLSFLIFYYGFYMYGWSKTYYNEHLIFGSDKAYLYDIPKEIPYYAFKFIYFIEELFALDDIQFLLNWGPLILSYLVPYFLIFWLPIFVKNIIRR